ncbi:PREDICTED: endocuticle structural glycoprotein SgAbd-2 [Ceratosolen solmsi marchali]|uniref:Endocuticle structural glycoprotein SgAbd-2 n=1 Tax=Ceratosolen solmsi marchali TaxID=326594 RepID=A0AAJ6YL57_9HYME|nr:PREDICTED: endocuticle structural glycoprotein SgAbd-2 [Ceratosolen solmsi marchali]
MRTAILAVMLGLAVAQDSHRGRPFHNPNQAFQQQQQQQQQQNQNLDNGQYQEQRNQYQEQSSGPIDRRSTTTPIPIIQWNKQQEHDGTYRTSYETGNNIIAEESGYIKTVGEGEDQGEALVQQGSYSYTSPEGQLITIHYTADETGFHASGDHIPTPPPVSEEIQKGLDLIYAGIRQQQEAAAREAAQKGNQPLNQQIDRRDDSGKYRP